jgi:pimeloyl-ACP methyl ester carboxylesterase
MSALLWSSPLLVLAGALALESGLRRRDRRRFPPPGQRVGLGGHELHARVLGSGDPVVVLEADAGAWSASWDQLPERLSEFTTVVAYDRAGLGWSDPGPGQRCPHTLARELHGLLRELVPDRPVILVAHGAGMRVARTFAGRYPFELAGMLVVDGEHESLADDLRAQGLPSPAVGPGALRLLDLAGRLGLLRALGYSPLGELETDLALPAHALAALRALAPATLAAVRAEELAALESGPDPIQLEVPVEVLVATSSLPAQGTPKDFPREAFNRLWARSSARLADLSSAGVVHEVQGDHFFHLRRPQVIEEAVRRLLGAARA